MQRRCTCVARVYVSKYERTVQPMPCTDRDRAMDRDGEKCESKRHMGKYEWRLRRQPISSIQ